MQINLCSIYFTSWLQFSIKTRICNPLCYDITYCQCWCSCSAGFCYLDCLPSPEILALFGTVCHKDLRHKIFWRNPNLWYCFEEAKNERYWFIFFAWCTFWSQVTISVTIIVLPTLLSCCKKWHCSTQLLWEYKAKHLCMLLISSCIALHALDMKVQHVKSCT